MRVAHLSGTRRFAAVMVALAVLGGCAGSAVSRGAEFYEQRRYIDAAQVFEQTEVKLSEYELEERARYAVYRGATLLALGDREGARRWFEYGASIDAQLLPPAERGLLARGLYVVNAGAPSGGAGRGTAASARAPR